MKRISEPRLKAVYDYIKAYEQERGKAPTLREIGKACQINSTSSVCRMIANLESRDLIQTVRNGTKTYIKVPSNLSAGRSVTASILGVCPCGEPILAEENILATVALPVEIFGDGAHFMLYAKGNSMVDCGIFDGDLMVVKVQETANVGEVVVARVNGEDATAKLLAATKDGRYYLKPANDSLDESGNRLYRNIYPEGDWEIIGVVDHVIHKPKFEGSKRWD